jgi:hypothetical protein
VHVREAACKGNHSLAARIPPHLPFVLPVSRFPIDPYVHVKIYNWPVHASAAEVDEMTNQELGMESQAMKRGQVLNKVAG